VLDRLIVLLPEAWGEWRDRGLAHAERGNTAEAMADLETYLAHVEDGLDIDLVSDRLSALRAGG
ncbi:MAG: tetratricopeptide repeat protein, partial [Acidovorax sp.]